MEIKTGPVTQNGIGLTKRYFLVPEFDTTSKADWQALRDHANSLQVNKGEALIAGYLKLSQHYELSPIGEDIGKPYHDRAIAQYVVTVFGKQMFFSDPFGGGFEEPGPVPEDFGI